MLPDHLSVSQLTKFLMYPLAYRFRYVDGIETGVRSSGLVLGSAFHVAAERLHRDILNGGMRTPETYRDLLAESLATEFGNFDVRLKDGESEDSLRSEGAALIDLYREYRAARKTRVLGVEQRIVRALVNLRTGEVLDVPFVSVLDLIEHDDRGVVVVDLKTSGRSYAPSAVDADLQLTAYGLLMLLWTGEHPRRLRIDALVRNRTPKLQQVETTRTEQEYTRFWTLAAAVRSAMAAGTFYPNPGWQCPTCEYAEDCRRWGMEGAT